LNGTEIAFVVAPPEFVPDNPAEHLDECLDTWKKTLPMFAAGGSIVHTGWDLVCQNAARLCAQFESRSSDDDDTAGWRPAGCGLVGPADRLLIDPLAQIDPQVVFDTTRGPVTIEAGAVVTAFSRIQGPCHIGSGTHVKSARIGGGTTLGPSCHVSGHVECSILQGLSNKFHEGFLGHSYVGSWVNIGAGVQVSDLRIAPSESVPPETAHTRTGALIGDYSNLAIGSLIDAGTVIGVFAETIPTGQLLPSLVPSFCTTSGDRLVERSDLDSLLASAATLMARRGRALSPAHIALIRTLFAATAPDRRHALRDVERRRLRKTA
jgi:acetyltransferase-like isoleucine patch superfamily enzyme